MNFPTYSIALRAFGSVGAAQAPIGAGFSSARPLAARGITPAEAGRQGPSLRAILRSPMPFTIVTAPITAISSTVWILATTFQVDQWVWGLKADYHVVRKTSLELLEQTL
ncbi:MAG: hypothetical protein ABSG30_18085 [Steroidobacteraceae bacterium]|jgi:hypothetical protein